MDVPQRKIHKLYGLQLLRAFAAISVCASHSATEFLHGKTLKSAFDYGGYGVDLFFVLSGIVLWLSTREAVPGWRSSTRFVVRRLIRIVPLYWSVTLALALGIILFPASFRSLSSGDGRLPLSLLFFPQQGPPLLIVGWSLIFELFFYAFFALGLLNKRMKIIAFSSLFGLGLIGLLFPDPTRGPWADLIFNSLHLEFLLGMGAGWLYEKRRIPPIWISIALVGLCLWLLVTRGESHRALVCGGIGFGLVMAALAVEPRLGAIGRYGAVLGDASYDLYLIHLPLVVALARMRGHLGLHSDHLGLIVSLVFAQVVALVCWKFFDQPIQKRLNRLLLG